MLNVISWSLKKFTDLSAIELYEILKVRNEVFVVEQNCPYLDPDGKDVDSYHLCGYIDGRLAAYVRILPPGLAFEEASIGRVLTQADFRNKRLGKPLMTEAIARTHALYGTNSIRIGAQQYLQKFYTELGFIQASDTYFEDDIPHIEMVLTKN